MMPDLKYPERLLQPFKSLTHFSQELYAMFRNADTEAERGPFETAPKPTPKRPAAAKARQALPEITPYESPGDIPASPPPERAVAPVTKVIESKISPPRSVAEERRISAATPPVLPTPARRSSPAESPRNLGFTPPVQQEPPTFSKYSANQKPGPPPPSESPKAERRDREDAKTRKEWDDIWGKARPDFQEPEIGGAAGTNVFVGKVMSYTHPIAKCVIYDNGPALDPSDTTQVDVTIQDVSAGEDFHGVTWLYSIFQFSDSDGNSTYFAQPPMWVA